jgi:hypothetical protein
MPRRVNLDWLDGMGYGQRPGAQVAQLVEHATENRSVGGSIPPLGTIPLPLTPLFAAGPTLQPA